MHALTLYKRLRIRSNVVISLMSGNDIYHMRGTVSYFPARPCNRLRGHIRFGDVFVHEDRWKMRDCTQGDQFIIHPGYSHAFSSWMKNLTQPYTLFIGAFPCVLLRGKNETVPLGFSGTAAYRLLRRARGACSYRNRGAVGDGMGRRPCPTDADQSIPGTNSVPSARRSPCFHTVLGLFTNMNESTALVHTNHNIQPAVLAGKRLCGIMATRSYQSRKS